MTTPTITPTPSVKNCSSDLWEFTPTMLPGRVRACLNKSTPTRNTWGTAMIPTKTQKWLR